MKNIGQILKNARIQKNYSVRDLEEITKIRANFIEAIERQKWESLPAFPTVLGFVKSLTAPLGLDETSTAAVLKRDYPPKKLSINPKPDVIGKFVWSPRLTFIVGIIIAAAAIFGYLGFQYYRFVSPPALSLDSPKEGQIVTGQSVLVFGLTDSDVKITVNNQPVLVDDNGKFSVSIGVSADTKEIDVVALNRSGKNTTIRRTIIVQ